VNIGVLDVILIGDFHSVVQHDGVANAMLSQSSAHPVVSPYSGKERLSRSSGLLVLQIMSLFVVCRNSFGVPRCAKWSYTLPTRHGLVRLQPTLARTTNDVGLDNTTATSPTRHYQLARVCPLN
jgi:hypothetical protein